MIAALKPLPPRFTVQEFLAWPGDGSGRTFHLVDGELRAMAPASPTHGTIQATVAYLLARHLRDQRSVCRAVTAPGVVPRVRAESNLRIPDVAVTCAPDDPRHRTLPDPILVIEILSPGNEADSWANVWAYTTIPSVREILVLHSTEIAAAVLRRQADGHWPEHPEALGPDGVLRLDAIGFACRLAEAYAQTHLADTGPPRAGQG